MIFYIYAAFIYHPDVASGAILQADRVRKGMEFCLYLIIVFSFMFILYSNSAFLKTRKQEFGLFSLFGMTKAQLRKLVVYENMSIAMMAIGAGIGLGVLFSKLFFMALGAMLEIKESISFAVPLKSVVMTAGGFFLLFLGISIWTVMRMGRTEIIDMLGAARKPKGKLVYSRWLVLLTVACLVSGTVHASVTNGWMNSNAVTMVMDDLSYVDLASGVPEEQQRVYYGIDLANWEKTAPTVEKLQQLVPESAKGDIDFYRAERYVNNQLSAALTLFIGLFISLLFFIAAGSMIYFKLFTELQEDQTQFRGLMRIGMTRKEIRRIVVSQIAIVFFIPCLVGIVHALFAMVALDNMMDSSNWLYSFVVIGIYIVMQTLYFLLASGTYMGTMLRGASTSS
jgi:putative ABC transport system permease protein